MRGPPGPGGRRRRRAGALLVEHAEVADGRCDAQGARQRVCLALLAGEALAGQGQEFALGGLARLGRGSIGHDAQRQVRVGMQSDVCAAGAAAVGERPGAVLAAVDFGVGDQAHRAAAAVAGLRRFDAIAHARQGAARYVGSGPRTGSWVLLLLRGSTPKTWIVICSGSTDRCGGGAPRRHRRPARTRRPGTGGEGRRSRLRPGFDQAAGAQHKFFLQVGDALGAGAAVEIPLAQGGHYDAGGVARADIALEGFGPPVEDSPKASSVRPAKRSQRTLRMSASVGLWAGMGTTANPAAGSMALGEGLRCRAARQTSCMTFSNT